MQTTTTTLTLQKIFLYFYFVNFCFFLFFFCFFCFLFFVFYYFILLFCYIGNQRALGKGWMITVSEYPGLESFFISEIAFNNTWRMATSPYSSSSSSSTKIKKIKTIKKEKKKEKKSTIQKKKSISKKKKKTHGNTNNHNAMVSDSVQGKNSKKSLKKIANKPTPIDELTHSYVKI